MQRKQYNRLYFILISLFLIGLLQISLGLSEQQSLGTLQTNSTINLIQNCVNSTYSNITRVVYPNGSFSINSQTSMTKNNFDYNYTYNSTSQTGQYLVYGICDENGILTTWDYNLFINGAGSELSTGQAILYVLGVVFSFVIFFLFLYFSITTPFFNVKNEEGKIVSINDLKYLKVLFIVMAYLSALFTVALLDAILKNLLYINGIGLIFNWIYSIMMGLMYPLLVLSVILSFVLYLNDLVDGKKMKRRNYR